MYQIYVQWSESDSPKHTSEQTLQISWLSDTFFILCCQILKKVCFIWHTLFSNCEVNCLLWHAVILKREVIQWKTYMLCCEERVLCLTHCAFRLWGPIYDALRRTSESASGGHRLHVSNFELSKICNSSINLVHFQLN